MYDMTSEVKLTGGTQRNNRRGRLRTGKAGRYWEGQLHCVYVILVYLTKVTEPQDLCY